MLQAGGDSHNLLEPQLNDDCFTSKTFLIRYCEEVVEVNDLVMWRAEVEVQRGYLQTEFYLSCELYFCDLSPLGGPTGWKRM
jgi:hypothetical protein